MYYKNDVTFVCTLLLCKENLGNKQLWKIYQSIPAEYYKNQYGNMKGSTRKYVDRKCLMFNEICINEEMLSK